MTGTELANINSWIAVIAIVSVVQLLALVTITVMGYRLYSSSRRVIAGLEQRHVAPVARRVHALLDDVSQGMSSLRTASDGVQDTLHGIHTGVDLATSAVTSAVWPGWAVARGVIAAVAAFREGGGKRRRTRHRDRQTHLDEDAYVNEGGNDNEAI